MKKYQVRWTNVNIPLVFGDKPLEIEGPYYRFKWQARLGALLRNLVDAIVDGGRNFYVVGAPPDGD